MLQHHGHCQQGCPALLVLSGKQLLLQVATLVGNPPAFAFLSFRDSSCSECLKCTSWPAGTEGRRNCGRGTDGMGKTRSGENELGHTEVPLVGTETSNQAQFSVFTVAEREGRRKAAWQDAQS